MDLTKAIAELRAERAAIEEAILVLERLAAAGPRRRGRPPAWMSGTSGRRGRFIRTPEARARMAAAQRRRWAKRRRRGKPAEA